MASLLQWLGLKNKKPVNTAPREVQQKLQNAKYGVFANRPQAQQQFTQQQRAPANVPLRLDLRQGLNQTANIVKGIGEGTGLPFFVRQSIVNPIKESSAILTGNQQAQANASKFYNQPLNKQLTQLGGNIANLALTAGAPAVTKGINAGVSKVLPNAVPKLAGKVVSGGLSGATLGAPFNVATLAQQGVPLTGENIKKAAIQGATFGGALGGGVPLVAGAVRARAPLNQTGAVGKNVNKPPQVGKTPVADLPQPKLPTTVPKSPNTLQKAFTSTRGELSQQGTGGAAIASKLDKWRTNSEVAQQSFLDSIPTAPKLGKQYPEFVDALEALSRGERPVMSPRVKQAVDEWSSNITRVQELAVASGRDVGNRGPYYYPRDYSDLLKTKNGFNSAVNHLVQTGQVKSRAEAIQQLRFMKSGREFGHFKTREFDIPGYDKSPKVLSKYVAGAFDDISRAEQFGPKNEIGNQLLARVAEEGYDASRAMKNLDIALGNVDKSTTGHKVSSGIRKFNAVRSLSTAGISNATQLPVNTSTIAGFGRTLKGVAKTATSPQARAQARKSGVLLDSAIENLAKQGLGTGGTITRNIASPFFRKIERFNRQATAVVGSDWGNSLAAKAAKGNMRAERTLRDKLGITGKIGNKLTPAQEIQASRKLVELSQFKVDPQDLPAWVDSPTGKLIAQFRTFGYKQTGFVYNQVLREAVKGNFLPLARFVTIAIPAGAGAQYLKSQIKGTKYTEPGESKLSQGVKAVAAVGGFGLPGSEGQNLYKSAQYGNLPGGVAGTFGGPTASFLTESSVNVGKAIDKNTRPLIKQAVRNIPSIGPSIANRAFPAKDTTETASSKKSTDTKDIIKAAFGSKEGKDFLKLTDEEKKSQAQSDPNIRALYDQWTSMKTALGGGDALYPEGLSKSSIKTLQQFDRLTTEARDKVINSRKDAEYRLALANYEKNKLTKSYSQADEIKEGNKLAKLKVGVDYDKSLRDLYGLNKGEVYDFITTDPNGKALSEQLLAYDDALLKAGVISKSKFRDRYGNIAFDAESGGGSKKPSTAGYKTASSAKIKAPSGIKVKAPSYSKGSVKTRKLSVSKIPSNYLSKRLA